MKIFPPAVEDPKANVGAGAATVVAGWLPNANGAGAALVAVCLVPEVEPVWAGMDWFATPNEKPVCGAPAVAMLVPGCEDAPNENGVPVLAVVAALDWFAPNEKPVTGVLDFVVIAGVALDWDEPNIEPAAGVLLVWFAPNENPAAGVLGLLASNERPAAVAVVGIPPEVSVDAGDTPKPVTKWEMFVLLK